MSTFVNPFSPKRQSGFTQKLADLKSWTRDRFGLDEQVTVSVNELACALPGCAPKETVILILNPVGSAQKLSIHKAVLDVGQDDVSSAQLETLEGR